MPSASTAGRAVAIRRHLTSSGVRLGSACSSSAATPLTTAAACEVPDMLKKRLLYANSGCSLAISWPRKLMTPSIWAPGATSSGLTKPSNVGPVDEKTATNSCVWATGIW